MRKFLLSLAFFAALGASSVYAESYPGRDRIIRKYDDNRIYRDDRGEYHWQVIVREVWIPEQRTGGIFGSRRIPGHYEQREYRYKIYHHSKRYNSDRYQRERSKKKDSRYGNSKRDDEYRRDNGRWDSRDKNEQRDTRRENDRWDD
ncbi:hypothetical protein WG906_00265 [Pedobacter sp. P351]|uniref:hypothetical protein n=1 Tax=Pedobacter superstes TaxID=3133441 RepID=UPI0030A117C7